MDQLRVDQTTQLDQMLHQVLTQTSASATTLTTGGHISTATTGSPILPASNPTSQQPLQTGTQQMSQPQPQQTNPQMGSSSTGVSVPTNTQQTIPQPQGNMGPSSTGISATVPILPMLSSHTSNPPPTLSQQSQGQMSNLPQTHMPSVPHSSQGMPQPAGPQQQQRMGGHMPATSQLTNHQRKLILKSQKLINLTISDTDKLTQFLTDISQLKSAVLEHYRIESEKIQCQVVKYHLKGQVRVAGDRIFESMGATNYFKLDRYLTTLFQMSFPSSNTALEQGFRKLKQGRSSIIQYGQKVKS
jgi:hypothetical protein